MKPQACSEAACGAGGYSRCSCTGAAVEQDDTSHVTES